MKIYQHYSKNSIAAGEQHVLKKTSSFLFHLYHVDQFYLHVYLHFTNE